MGAAASSDGRPLGGGAGDPGFRAVPRLSVRPLGARGARPGAWLPGRVVCDDESLDVALRPATSVPAGLSDGLPVGLMIVGRQLAGATCLRVAQAYETTVGGFPAPPAPT